MAGLGQAVPAEVRLRDYSVVVDSSGSAVDVAGASYPKRLGPNQPTLHSGARRRYKSLHQDTLPDTPTVEDLADAADGVSPLAWLPCWPPGVVGRAACRLVGWFAGVIGLDGCVCLSERYLCAPGMCHSS